MARIDASSCSNPYTQNRRFLCNITRYAHLCHLQICEQQQGDQKPLNCQTCWGKSKGWPPPCTRPAVAPERDAATSLGKGPRPAQNRWQTWNRRTSSPISPCTAPNYSQEGKGCSKLMCSAKISEMLQAGCSSDQVDTVSGISAFPRIEVFGKCSLHTKSKTRTLGSK